MEIKKQIKYIQKKDKTIVYYEVWRDDKLLGTFGTSKLAKQFINEVYGVKNVRREAGEVEEDSREIPKLPDWFYH